MSSFTHLDDKGQVRMVDVTPKEPTHRFALAQGTITLNQDTFSKIQKQKIKKGNVLETARIAGVMAAKKTAELIPMCHPLMITHVQVDFDLDADRQSIQITASVRIWGQTGVEMEALTAVSVAALTVYDMCKSYDKAMTIGNICLLEKTGGKSGAYQRKNLAR
jgi:cyclic pyranopterin phosphate synthase